MGVMAAAIGGVARAADSSPVCGSSASIVSKNRLGFGNRNVAIPALNTRRKCGYRLLSLSAIGRDSMRGITSEAQETATSATAVNESTFPKLVLESEIPVLVDFWAPWCGPCRMIAPLIDELAKQYAGKLRCLKLNTDECPNLATEYGIRSIPTVLIFVNGEKKETIIGAVPKSNLTSMIDKHLS